ASGSSWITRVRSAVFAAVTVFNCWSICPLLSRSSNQETPSGPGWIRTSDLHHVKVTGTPGFPTRPVHAQSGRQDSNLPRTAYQTVASPLGHGPNHEQTECPAGIEPAFPRWKRGAWAARPRAR